MRSLMEHLNQLFVEAGTLMLAGMVFVFTFLGLLIVFINVVLTRLATKFPDAVPQASRAQAKSTRSNQINKNNVDGISPKLVAAITSAVTQYRKQHNQNSSTHKTK
jgi:oxaloacetate decarboxylase gamma subunit